MGTTFLAYDPAGNRTQKVVTVDGSPTTNNYTYNALNQFTGDGVNSYTWDRANRLLGMGGHSYAYDGQGRRVSQTVDSGLNGTRTATSQRT
ncbi:MAG: hypothetical protein P8Z40_04520 [Chloroflexota bacterium]